MFVVIKMTKNINHTHTTMKDGYVVGLGEALWDVLPDGKKLGGAPANDKRSAIGGNFHEFPWMP